MHSPVAPDLGLSHSHRALAELGDGVNHSDSAVRGVTDAKTGGKKKISFSAKTLGTIKLNEFDPSLLPEVKLK